MINRKIRIEGIVSAAILALSSLLLPAALSANTVIDQTTVITACGKLFEIDSNAADLTAAQRASIVQHKLDNALVHARDLSPSAVRISMIRNNPVVSLDHFMIVTADGNSAARNRLSQMELAEKWANSLRFCLADSAAMQKYIAMLTGRYPHVATAGPARDDIAIAPPGMLFPVKLASSMCTNLLKIGDSIEAVVSNDVPFEPWYTSYLPAGTIALGKIVSAHQYTPNDFAGKGALTIDFYEFRTPDSRKIPIEGHILGGVDSFRMINALPTTAMCTDNSTAGEFGNLTKVHVIPSKGYIVGGWKAESLDNNSVVQYPRLIFSGRRMLTSVNAGEPMLLQLSATTAVALAGRRFLSTALVETH